MSEWLSIPDREREELWSLVDRLNSGMLTVQERDRLESLVVGSEDAAMFCAVYADLHAMLRWRFRPLKPDAPSSNTSLPASVPALTETVPGAIARPLPQSDRPGPIFLTDTLHDTVGYLSSGWPVAYLVATVIFGIGLLIGSLVHVSQPVELARQLASLPSPLSSLPSTVGRITGMVDCRWATKGLGVRDWGLEEGSKSKVQRSEEVQSLIPDSQSLVRLGDKFALASGLVEITYDTGAKVILQGPVTYKVESRRGGFLSVGKLTARVEGSTKYGVRSTESVASGQWPVGSDNQQSAINNQRSSNPQSLIPNPSLAAGHWPLFTINTPSATVTDLGTEFGVEVSKEGHTTSHVFRGSVKVQFLDAAVEQEGSAVVLHENESLRTEKGDLAGGRVVVMRRVSVNPQTFVRRIAKPAKVLDLLDIVAGGSGFGRHRERGIDPGTGREDSLFVTEGHDGDGRYRPVALHKLIDGVFIPDGRRKPMVLDSAGHTFDGFAPTCGRSYGLIWARAADLRTDGDAQENQFWVYCLGRGEQFMPNHRGLLCMHANAGITFNLEAMHKLYSGDRPARFRAFAGVAKANAVTYTANFKNNTEGWGIDTDSPYWGSTGGQDGGGYVGGVRDNACPYLTPPLNSILCGDLASNFGSHILTFSYYLKNLGGSPSGGGQLYMFADCGGSGSWDTVWQWTPSDTSVPHEWRKYTWTVDTTADAAAAGWSRVSGSGSWADSWKHVKNWNFWENPGTGSINNGIDKVVVSGAEPATPPAGSSAARSQLADIWVFVDGRLKLKRVELRPKDGVVLVDVELGPNDRFLTLASTDGGNGNWLDWVVFGDPVLDIASTDEDRL